LTLRPLAKMAPKRGKTLAPNTIVSDIPIPGKTDDARLSGDHGRNRRGSNVALRFASRRAVRKPVGTVHLLALVPRQQFVAFSGIQATIEEEARVRAEALVTAAAGNLLSEGAKPPAIAVTAAATGCR
jgi:hypothetical protein